MDFSLLTTFDLIVLTMGVCCLLLIVYGICKFCVVHSKLDKKPNRRLVIAGMVFFIISAFTILNAILYDTFYIFCPILDQWEGPIFHSIYFIQLYSLWLVLFLRLYYVFQPTANHQLSRHTLIAWTTAFILIPCAIIPLYFVFHLKAERFITLPYVILSFFVSIALLTAFVYKLRELVHDGIGADHSSSLAHRRMVVVMTKNTLLAGFSIVCSLSVVAVFMALQIKHSGFHERYSATEEFVLELFILLDIVSNILCVLLSYSFFEAEYKLICTCCDSRMMRYFHMEIDQKVSRKRLQSDPCTLDIGPAGVDDDRHDTDGYDETERGEDRDLLPLTVAVEMR